MSADTGPAQHRVQERARIAEPHAVALVSSYRPMYTEPFTELQPPNSLPHGQGMVRSLAAAPP